MRSLEREKGRRVKEQREAEDSDDAMTIVGIRP
jgi:hypothetical protein